jgi:beta-glucosidase
VRQGERFVGKNDNRRKILAAFYDSCGLKKDEDKYRNGIFGFVYAFKEWRCFPQLLNYSTAEDAVCSEKINAIRNISSKVKTWNSIIAFDESAWTCTSRSNRFPQAIGLAASWDTSLCMKYTNAIAEETKARGIRQILSPVINIASDPRWGRGSLWRRSFPDFEMGVAFVRHLKR